MAACIACCHYVRLHVSDTKGIRKVVSLSKASGDVGNAASATNREFSNGVLVRPIETHTTKQGHASVGVDVGHQLRSNWTREDWQNTSPTQHLMFISFFLSEVTFHKTYYAVALFLALFVKEEFVRAHWISFVGIQSCSYLRGQAWAGSYAISLDVAITPIGPHMV